MNKLKFMAISLPYGLKFIDVFDSIEDLKSFDVTNMWANGNPYFKINKIKPILFPLSSLTKEIEHNGEKFVPIVELAKIIVDLPDRFPYCFETKVSSILQSEKHEFGYNHRGQSFHLFDRESMEFKPFPNQLELFQNLIEWHFDIAGLIEKGEAIDVNTLETNPYK